MLLNLFYSERSIFKLPPSLTQACRLLKPGANPADEKNKNSCVKKAQYSLPVYTNE